MPESLFCRTEVQSMGFVLTYEDFLDAALANQSLHTEWRWGQTLYNTLWGVNSNLATHIARSDADPFYRDEAIPLFLTVVYEYYEAFASVTE